MLCEIAENYFNSMSPLAARICGDIRSIRSAYEDLWNDLSLAEQEQIINETFIHPHVQIKYSFSGYSLTGKGGCRFATGAKKVIDENSGASWRDEYSAPFSWKGRSQFDLCRNERCFAAVPQPCPLAIEAMGPNTGEEGINPPQCDTVDGSHATLGAISDFCSRLKMPGKSKDYQVSHSDGGLLSKIKTNTVCKLQSTLRMVSGKVGSRQSGEGEMLVIGGRAVIVPKQQKPSPKKPTSPPPPPPPRILLQKDFAETPLLSPNTPIFDEKKDHSQYEQPLNENDGNGSVDSLDLAGEGSLLESAHSRESIVPKSGFDFLDNW